MPRVARELTPIQIRLLKSLHDGRPTMHPVGGISGLHLQVTPSGARSWVLRITVARKRREIGLGSYPEVGVKAARDTARAYKQTFKEGGDPVKKQREAKQAYYTLMLFEKTFVQVFDEFVIIKRAELSRGKNFDQWPDSIATYALPHLGSKTVSTVTVDDVLKVLRPIWETKYPTADKLRRNLCEIFVYSKTAGYCEGDNPARWKGLLARLLPNVANAGPTPHYPALKLEDLKRFWTDLARREGNSAAALRFQMLTASRSGAIRFMKWHEVDLENRLWTVQPGRESSKISKRDQAKRVPLCEQALAILDKLPRRANSDFVFWSPKGGALSDAALGAVMAKIHAEDISKKGEGYTDIASGRPAVPHGFRTAFKQWANEIGDYEYTLSEQALWHSVGTLAAQAYNRTDSLTKRKAMMQQWADYFAGNYAEAIPA